MKADRIAIASLYACALLVSSCAQAPINVAAPSSPRDYVRGTTDYVAGNAKVVQPNIYSTPDRSFDGFRVAGPDSDLVLGYWDALLSKMSQEGRGVQGVFEVFRARHKDLEIYQTQASSAVLREFRRWADQRGYGSQFGKFWDS